VSRTKLITGIVIHVAIYAALLFVPAETLHWWRAWVFLGIALVTAIAGTLALWRVSPELLEERFKSPIQKGQPLSDKILVALLLTAFFGQMVFIPLDVFRFHLLPQPNGIVSLVGLALYLLGSWLVLLTLRANAFAALVVKDQSQRNQTVVDTGVYSIVRHPLYASVIPLWVGIALWLESTAGAIAAIAPIGVLAIRILFEELYLQQHLQGYSDYMTRIRYRLIPFVW
jgi:protein-S-isoprenylcysteine O-methyltransferase Ste14